MSFIPLASMGADDNIRLKLSTYVFAPYITLQRNNVDGIVIEKMKCILAQLDRPYKITVNDWVTSYLELTNNKSDGFFMAQKSSDLDRYGQISNPIVSFKLNWFFANDKKYKINETSKSKLKFAAVYGSQNWFMLKSRGYNLVGKPRNISELIELLKKKDVNVVIEDNAAFKFALQSMGEPTDYFKFQFFEDVDLGVYFSNEYLKSHLVFLHNFNAALAACRD